MTTGTVTAEDGPLGGLYFTNDVSGTSKLPRGRYRVHLTREWDDYETGQRMVGILLDDEDLETARRIGTTGYSESDMPYAPSEVYFSGDQFTPDAGVTSPPTI